MSSDNDLKFTTLKVELRNALAPRTPMSRAELKTYGVNVSELSLPFYIGG